MSFEDEHGIAKSKMNDKKQTVGLAYKVANKIKEQKHEKKESMAKKMKFKHQGKEYDIPVKTVKEMPKPRFNMGNK